MAPMRDASTSSAIKRIVRLSPSIPGGRKSSYSVLNLSSVPTPSWAEVQAAFRHLSRLLHPDKVDDPFAEDVFKEVTAAGRGENGLAAFAALGECGAAEAG
eukprot:scaffold101796_cov28-Tisochrysis_lutea.AAC.1